MRSERRLQSVVAGCGKQGVDERIVTVNRLAGTRFRCRLDEIVEGHRVQRLPACEEVGLVARDQRTMLGALRQVQIDGRGEAAVEGGDRLGWDAGKGDRLFALGQVQYVAGDLGAGDGQGLASLPSGSSNPKRSGICIGALLLCPGVGGTVCSSDSVYVCLAAS